MKKWWKSLGPGTLVAAAFIGPGTVTVCSVAGADSGFTLLWALLLAILGTVVFQEMAARLGVVGQLGLAEAIRHQIKWPIFKYIALVLIISAILVGNAAYEAGNITGGVLGVQTLIPDSTFSLFGLEFNYLNLLIGALAFILLYIGNYRILEKSLIAMVVLMSISFVVTAIITNPNWIEVLKGLFVPRIPDEGWVIILALIGTTVVPYNLFLHASLVKEKWKGAQYLKTARRDTYISIGLGGLVSIAIVVCASVIEKGGVTNAADLAKGLEPLYGQFASLFLSIGLFAAGITSAVTAPLAAAYVARGCFGWNDNLKDPKFRAVWILILILGVLVASQGWKPVQVIQFAQVANGILLPVVAVFLLWIVNRKNIMGNYRNTKVQNVLGVLILLFSMVLSIRQFDKVFGFLPF